MTEQTEKIMIMRRLVETYSRRSTGLPVLLVVRSAELDSPTTQWATVTNYMRTLNECLQIPSYSFL